MSALQRILIRTKWAAALAFAVALVAAVYFVSTESPRAVPCFFAMLVAGGLVPILNVAERITFIAQRPTAHHDADSDGLDDELLD